MTHSKLVDKFEELESSLFPATQNSKTEKQNYAKLWRENVKRYRSGQIELKERGGDLFLSHKPKQIQNLKIKQMDHNTMKSQIPKL